MAHNFLFHRPNITKKELVSVLDCIISDELSFGNIVLKYEKTIEDTFNFEKAFCCPSVSSAYHLTLLSLNIQEGDEIIVSSTTPISVIDAIHYVKATPIIVDLQDNNLHVNPTEIALKITERTKVIILDYPYGSYYDFKLFILKVKDDTLLKDNTISTKNIKIIEDISYLIHELLYKNKNCDSTLTDFTIIGLNETMNMTIGKGAIVCTSLKKYITNIHILRNQDKDLATYSTRYDYTITDYQAAIGIEQIHHLGLTNKRIQSIANLYLQNIQKNTYIQPLFFNRGYDQYGGGFPIIFQSERTRVEALLKKEHIPYQRLIQHRPVHHYFNSENNQISNEYKNIQRLYEKSIVLPIYANLSKREIEKIIRTLMKIT